jgi:hypothetical protein
VLPSRSGDTKVCVLDKEVMENLWKVPINLQGRCVQFWNEVMSFSAQFLACLNLVETKDLPRIHSLSTQPEFLTKLCIFRCPKT